MIDAPSPLAAAPPPVTPARLAPADAVPAVPFADALGAVLAPAVNVAADESRVRAAMPSSLTAAAPASDAPAGDPSATSDMPTPHLAEPLPLPAPTLALPTSALPIHPIPLAGSAVRGPAGPGRATATEPDEPTSAEQGEDVGQGDAASGMAAPNATIPPFQPPPPPPSPQAVAGSGQASDPATDSPAPGSARSLDRADPGAPPTVDAKPGAPALALTQSQVPDLAPPAPHPFLPNAPAPTPPTVQPSTAASQAAAPLPSPPTTVVLPLPQVAPMVASVAATVRAGQEHALVIRLDPAELGRVEVQIERTAGGPARISLSAERPATLQALQADQARLHHALDLAGVPPDNRQVQYLLAPSPAQPSSANASFTGGFGSGFGAGGGPGSQGSGRERHGGYASNTSGPDPNPTRRRRAGVDITA